MATTDVRTVNRDLQDEVALMSGIRVRLGICVLVLIAAACGSTDTGSDDQQPDRVWTAQEVRDSLLAPPGYELGDVGSNSRGWETLDLIPQSGTTRPTSADDLVVAQPPFVPREGRPNLGEFIPEPECCRLAAGGGLHRGPTYCLFIVDIINKEDSRPDFMLRVSVKCGDKDARLE